MLQGKVALGIERQSREPMIGSVGTSLVERSSPPTVDGTVTAKAEDAQLLAIEEDFRAVNQRLDHICALDNEASDPVMLELQRRWEEACSRAVDLRASTTDGLRAKARVLLAALTVLAPTFHAREPHERLAESLVQDLLR